jgi:N-acetylglutamate synthase-like GNAT family acetyltransferase
VWVLEQQGEIVGVVVLEEQPECLLLENVAVRPKEQSNGFGRRLIAFAEQEAARR